MVDNRYTFHEGGDCSMRQRLGDIENKIESRQIVREVSINFSVDLCEIINANYH